MDCIIPLGVLICFVIGPFTLKGNNEISYEFIHLTMVDPSVHVLEVEEILNMIV